MNVKRREVERVAVRAVSCSQYWSLPKPRRRADV